VNGSITVIFGSRLCLNLVMTIKKVYQTGYAVLAGMAVSTVVLVLL
jgi:hypothetical protein